MAIAKKIEGFITQSSWIRKMFEDGIRLKKEFGEDNVFDFSLGNPNVSPPERFKELIREVAADEQPGVHAYMPNAGNPEARRAVAEYLSKEHSVGLSAENIIMSCGAGGALNVALKTLLNPGDEVLIPAPFFVEYRFYVDNCGGTTRLVETNDDFSLDLEAIENAVTKKTKVVLINSPNNPTGKVYDEESVTALAQILEKKSIEIGQEIYLISDEPYRDIVYDGVKVPSVLKSYRHSIIATSYSKSISIPGERIGFLAINPGIADCDSLTGGMVLCTRILGFVNAPAFIQRVIGKMQGTLVDIQEYKRKRDLLCEGLSEAGYRFATPEGAFYLFPRSPIDDDVSFVKALQEKNILTVPGSGFGRSGHFRIAYCVNDSTIINSMEGFRETLNAFG